MQKKDVKCKNKIKNIYDKLKQKYGTPKITKELCEFGKIISERSVKYMKQMGIKVQQFKPWTITTKDFDFSSELKNILNEQFDSESQSKT